MFVIRGTHQAALECGERLTFAIGEAHGGRRMSGFYGWRRRGYVLPWPSKLPSKSSARPTCRLDIAGSRCAHPASCRAHPCSSRPPDVAFAWLVARRGSLDGIHGNLSAKLDFPQPLLAHDLTCLELLIALRDLALE